MWMKPAVKNEQLQAFGEAELEEIRCPVCGRDEARVKYVVEDVMVGWPQAFKLRECGDCGAAYYSPRPKPEAIGRAYAADFGFHTNLPEGKGEELLHRAVASQAARVDLLKRWGKAGGRLLDFGSGDGAFLLGARAAGFEVRGVEPDEGCRRRQAENWRVDSVAPPEEGTPWPFEDGVFDVVTMWGSLEHLHQPRYALAQAGRVLAPGGVVIVCVPNYRCVERVVFGRRWQPLLPPLHLTHFTPGSLERVFQGAGLELRDLWCASTATSLKMSLKGLKGGPLHHAGPAEAGFGEAAAAPEDGGGRSPVKVLKRLLFNGVLAPGIRLLDRLKLGPMMIAVGQRRG